MPSPSSASMKRVVPSSNCGAMLCGRRLLGCLPSSDVIDVDDGVNVVVLQDHLFGFDQGPFAGHFERVEGNAEIGVSDLVAIAERQPVEAQLDFAVVPGEDFDI